MKKLAFLIAIILTISSIELNGQIVTGEKLPVQMLLIK
jgi:hypothetical protein